jgi:hypothetical protein
MIVVLFGCVCPKRATFLDRLADFVLLPAGRVGDA